MKLAPTQLFTRCDPAELGFRLTSELVGQTLAVGQDRAVAAMQFAIAMKQGGFNLFVMGPSGSGRSRLAQSIMERQAFAEPVPNDVCYVHNFEDARRPRPLSLPPGQGARLRDHMERVIEDLPGAIRAAFEDQRYRERRQAIDQEMERRHEQQVAAVVEQATKSGVAVMRTAAGFSLAPMRDGKVLEPEELAKLGEEERRRFARSAETVHDQLHAVLQQVPQLQHEQRERVRALNDEITLGVVAELLSDVRRAFAAMPQVIEHIDAVQRDIIGRTAQMLRSPPQEESFLPMLFEPGSTHERLLRRYRINVLVDHRTSAGAPVVVEDHPTSGNLVGKIEHLSQFGVLMTDFNLIKAGALHRANGGYLIIDARRLLMQPVSWEQLKRTLRSGEIRIESVVEALDLAAAATIEPEPIPFSGKLVLIGEPWLYYRLAALDPEFNELFKVVADFESEIERTAPACRAYAELIARVVRNEGLPALEASAVARLLEHASRMAEDSTRLSMHVRSVFDLARESAHWASTAGREHVTAADVDRAIAERDLRHGQVRERVQAAIADHTLFVETSGKRVGQVNGLSVAQLGEVRFAFPSRITARARLGKGEVVDIQREVQLGGPIHSKGVLTLSAFLGGRYQTHKPLSLRATLVFEQAYGQVEGDSASLAELLALLSAVGALPLAQGIAVTGSVDQHSRVQAVGGVNDKIEGFFDVCRARGLDGSHGVIIPEANVKHLMLRQDVVGAVASDQFHVWAVADVDQAMEVAFGVPAGVRTDGGSYPEGSANVAVEAGLEALSRAALETARATQEKSSTVATGNPKRRGE